MANYSQGGAPWHDNADSIQSVVFTGNLTSIGSWAFENCSSLTSIDIPDTVTTIGDGAFVDCKGLTTFAIPSGVSCIDYYTFGGCTNLTSVDIPASVTAIEGFAFENCDGLTSFTVPDGVQSLGAKLFADCNNLTSVVLPANVTSIANNAFEGWPCADTGTIYCARTNYTEGWAANHAELNIVFFGEDGWTDPVYEWAENHLTATATRRNIFNAAPDETEETSQITMSVDRDPTETEGGATAYVARFTNEVFGSAYVSVEDIPALSEMDVLRLPESLTEIEKEAFAGLNCQAVIFPESCEYVRARAFAGCERLIYISISEDTEVDGSAFAGCDQLRQPEWE